MSWFAQTNYPYEKQGIGGKYSIAEIGCFVTSFCNLLQRFGKNIDPPTLNKLMIQRGIYIDVDDGIRDDLGWESITAYDGQVKLARHVDGPYVSGVQQAVGWPNSNNAIVKFSYISQRTGKRVTHFCLVADANAGTIIDSWDGQVKRPGIYGTPVAFAIYDNVVPQPVEPRVTPTPAPAPTPTPAGPSIRYEVLNNPRKMHVRNGKGDGSGANKYAFGSAKSWSDFGVVDHKPENYNVTIVAIAHHPIPPTGADYYMDAVALGDYQTNGGRVANTIGYSWADLADGWIEDTPAAPAPTPPATPVTPPAPATPVQTTPTVPEVTPAKPAPVATPTPVKAPEPVKLSPNAWKSSYKAMKPTKFVVRNDSVVMDYDGKRPNKVIRSNTEIEIGGTFIYRDTLYGRPVQSIENVKNLPVWFPNWYGIHMTNLISEEELFSLRATLADKVGAGASLNFGEMLALNLSRVKSSWARFNDRNKK